MVHDITHRPTGSLIKATTGLARGYGADGRPYFYHATTKETSWTRPPSPLDPAFSGPPLAMFTPGGGRADFPSWFDKSWAASGTRLDVPLELEFFSDDYGPIKDEPLKRTQARKLFTRCASPDVLDIPTSGVAWGMVQLSSIQALLVWSLDLPEGIQRDGSAADVTLPPDTRLYCSTQLWRGSELARLQPLLEELRAELRITSDRDKRSGLEGRIKNLERGLPREGMPTIEIPGLGADTVTICTNGQLAVRRLAPSGKLINPFENAGRLGSLNPFNEVPEFGVVGSFVLERTNVVGGMIGSDAPPVEVVVE